MEIWNGPGGPDFGFTPWGDRNTWAAIVDFYPSRNELKVEVCFAVNLTSP